MRVLFWLLNILGASSPKSADAAGLGLMVLWILGIYTVLPGRDKARDQIRANR